MPQHAEFQAGFAAGLRGDGLPFGITSADADRRFAVYRNNVTASLTDALAARFAVIGRLVGEAFFRAMARVYIDADPPASAVLHEWGAGFAAFLDGFAPLAGYPYMGDVARIEYARGWAFHAADVAAVDGAALMGCDPAVMGLGLHPSVQVLRLAHPAVTIWANNQPAARAMPVPAGAQTALILRDGGFNVPVAAIGAGDAALILALQAGAALEAAALAAQTLQPDHSAQPLLLALMQAGAITHITKVSP